MSVFRSKDIHLDSTLQVSFEQRSDKLPKAFGRIKSPLDFGRKWHQHKLQFGASPKVVHERITSQNMPIWQHKRTSSVILSYAKHNRMNIL